MARVRTPRAAWIEAGLQALAEGGPDAVRVEALAARLGVTKGGFYWHFSDRPALLAEMLDDWERTGTEEVLAHFDALDADARGRLRRLFEQAPTADFEIDLAVRHWARRDELVADRLRRIDTRRMGWLQTQFEDFADDPEARTMLAYSLLIGAYFVAAPGRRQMLGAAVEHLLR